MIKYREISVNQIFKLLYYVLTKCTDLLCVLGLALVSVGVRISNTAVTYWTLLDISFAANSCAKPAAVSLTARTWITEDDE